MKSSLLLSNYEGGIQVVTQHLMKHLPSFGAGQNELPDKPVP